MLRLSFGKGVGLPCSLVQSSAYDMQSSSRVVHEVSATVVRSCEKLDRSGYEHKLRKFAGGRGHRSFGPINSRAPRLTLNARLSVSLGASAINCN